MLILPTSMDTAMILEMPPLAMVYFSALLCGVFCLWEMLMSVLLGRPPSVSRWVWLGVSALLLASGALLFEPWLGPVTFNSGEMTTAWSFVLSAWCMALFVPCVLITLVIRTGRLPGNPLCIALGSATETGLPGPPKPRIAGHNACDKPVIR